MKRFFLTAGLLILSTFILSISPVTNKELSFGLDDVLGTIQSERKDQIDYIDHYKIIQEKIQKKAGDKKSKYFIQVRFFVKTQRGAEENFLLHVDFELKNDTWNYLSFKILDSIQTKPPVVRPARKQIPEKEIVFKLIRSHLKKESNKDQAYHLHFIKKSGYPKFEWGENYTRTRFVYTIDSKLKELDYNDFIRDYYKCKWKPLIEYNEILKQWSLVKIHKPSKGNKINSGCRILKQTFQEKIDNVFPGE